MNLRTGGGARGLPEPPVRHTGRAARRRGKSDASQLAAGPCERTAQVILGGSVATRKAWASPSEQGLDGSNGCALSQQLLGDPFVGDAPIGLRESLRDAQPLQPGLIDFAGRRGGAGCSQNAYGERTAKRSGSGNGARGARYLPVGGLHQRRTVGGQANPGVQDSHPGGVPVGLSPQGFLIGEPGQSSQMTPIGAGQVSPISAGQLSADGGGHGRFQRGGTDPNPGLEMAGAGLEYHAGSCPLARISSRAAGSAWSRSSRM